jgi:Protein of unknown function (DUF3617)
LFAHDLSEKPGSTFSAPSRKGDPERRIRMGEDAMSRSVAVLFLAAAFAMPAAAADMPSRKAGLWEVTTHVANHPMKMQQCIDAATDQAMQSQASSSGANCSKRDVQKTATGMTVDSVCTIAGKTMTSHIVASGSFDSNYSMTITSEGGSLPAARTITLEAKWLGPCAADQKPGDMLMSNGVKMNIIDMQKAMRPSGAPGAQPGH